MSSDQVNKAETLLALHHSQKILILSNIWDVLGAKLIEHLGFPAVATASAAVAFSQGLDDGEHIGFNQHLGILGRIAASVDLPVTADIEKGYAAGLDELADNIKKILEAGLVGINIEDSIVEGGELFSIEAYCSRLQTVRKTAVEFGVPLVINARTDVFLNMEFEGDPVVEIIERAHAYKSAGADCLFVTGCPPQEIERIVAEAGMPINIFAGRNMPSVRKLEEMGVARLSIGPALIRSALSRMKEVAQSLQNYGAYDIFIDGVFTSDEVREIIGR